MATKILSLVVIMAALITCTTSNARTLPMEKINDVQKTFFHPFLPPYAGGFGKGIGIGIGFGGSSPASGLGSRIGGHGDRDSSSNGGELVRGGADGDRENGKP
ncbi:hypothetical protein ACH5RR_017597 [Cinchona calisaya]|uniref:Glycine-rich protein n=1 Tax=Cinchona calisaya TaxID=153742 RepID=A0ABD2ZJC0_9GENT